MFLDGDLRHFASSWFKIRSHINGDASNDNSGFSVSLSSDGTVLAVGFIKSNNGNGYTRIYKYSSSSEFWIQLEADINGKAAGYLSGVSVSLSSDGKVVAI